MSVVDMAVKVLLLPADEVNSIVLVQWHGQVGCHGGETDAGFYGGKT